MTLLRHYWTRVVSLVAIGVVVLQTMLFCCALAEAQDLHTVTLSPDGRLITFNAGEKGIGQYDWRSSQLSYVPVPPGFGALRDPSYSADGSRLAVVADTRLGIVNLKTQEMSAFDIPHRLFAQPLFRPDGRAVLYLTGDMYRRPMLFDLRTRASRELLTEGNGFRSLYQPSFVAEDTILFTAMEPQDPDLLAELERRRIPSRGVAAPYRLKFGSKPELAYLDALAGYIDGARINLPYPMLASRGGERIAFIGLSQSKEARQAYRSGGLARYDLFVIEAGKARQVTRLENYLGYLSLSQDGSTAALGVHSKPLSEEIRRLGRRGGIPFDLAIVDLNTGEVTRTDYVQRMKAINK